MKKKSTSQSAFFYLRASIGLLLVLAGVFLALLGFGQFSAQAQQKNNHRQGVSRRPSSLPCLTVLKYADWASTCRKTYGLEP